MFKANTLNVKIAAVALVVLAGCGADPAVQQEPTREPTVGPTATVLPAQPSPTQAAREPTPVPPTATVEVQAVEPTATTPAMTFETYAKPEVLVDTQWVIEHLEDPQVRLVDVSPERTTYLSGHLPGAIYIDPYVELSNPDNPVQGEILTREALSTLLSRQGIERDDTVVLYDDTRNLWSTRAYWVFEYYQHEDVRVYNGGSLKWTADGQELVSDAVEVQASSYEAAPADPSIRTTWEDVVASVEDPNTLFCDARSIEEYTGERVQAARGGHIPGAQNIEWTKSVGPDGTFLPAPDLYTLYSEAGFTPDKNIVTYCQIGIRAAHTWFVLRELLGYPNVRTYDGSWAEYGNKDESPIEK